MFTGYFPILDNSKSISAIQPALFSHFSQYLQKIQIVWIQIRSRNKNMKVKPVKAQNKFKETVNKIKRNMG